MILVIFVSFLVCYLPITIVKVTLQQWRQIEFFIYFPDCRGSFSSLLVSDGLHLDLSEHLHQPHHLRADVYRVQTGLLQPSHLQQL